MHRTQTQPDLIAVVGTGVVGAAIGYALAREGRPVILLDEQEPGIGGASFGNVGHIATELVQPLPSVGLLFRFWRQLTHFGGPLDLPLTRLAELLPWMLRFACAAPRQADNTHHLAPLVVPAADNLERWLAQIGQSRLLSRNGYYEVGFGRRSEAAMRAQSELMARIGIGTTPMRAEELEIVQRAAGAETASGLWFQGAAHVGDPLQIVRAFVAAAVAHGASLKRMKVRAIQTRGDGFEVCDDYGRITVSSVVVCAGVHSAPLLAPFSVNAPLQAARGYHVELREHQPMLNAPILYTDSHIVVTPMLGRLRASSYIEFRPPGAPPDQKKVSRLRTRLQQLGYRCEPTGAAWVGSRPVLPDYLPGIGRAAAHPKLFYAVGHQHIGLTMSTTTADVVADLVAGRSPRVPVAPFDLQRFGKPT